MLSPRPGPEGSVVKPGFPMRPFYGIEPVLMSDDVRDDCSLSVCHLDLSRPTNASM